MTTPRRAAAAAPSPVTAAAPRRAAATPSARPGRLRTLTASALVVGVGATTGYALLLPPAPAALVAVAAPSGEPALSVIVPLADRVPDAAAAAPAALPAPVAPDAAPAPVAATAAAKVAATAARSAAAPATQAAVRTAAASRAATTVRATPATTTTTTTPAAPRTATTTPPRAPVAPAPTTTTAPVSTQAANSVTAQVAAYARAHIGYPYRVNTKGPETYDCAGLVTAAFASAGVTVRHSMTTQAALGSYVSRENLRPGDIVIWGDPVSAVSIYIGNDTIVIGDGAAYGVRTVTITERIKYRSFQGGRRYGG